MLLLVVICFLLIGTFLLRNYLSKPSRFKECGSKIPGPKPLPIVGNALEIGLSCKSIFQCMLWLTKQYGPVARFWIGTKLSILLADPDSIELLLGNNKHLDKSSIYDIASSFVGLGLVVNKGEMWRRHRKMITPTFHGQTLTRFVDIFGANIDVLIQKLSQYVSGPEFDINPVINLYTLDVICETAMGVKVNAQLHSDSEYVKAVSCMENILSVRGFRPWLYPDIIFNLTPHGRQQAKYLPVIRNEAKRMMEERKKLRPEETHTNATDSNNDAKDRDSGLKTRRAFLDNMLDYIAKGNPLSNEELLHELDTIMIAGHDTTTAGLSYTCWLLAKHQHVQERAVKEIRTIFGDSLRHATMQDLNEMKYLGQVIKESLRMLPPVSIFGRKLSEDINTGKYILPAGCEVGVNVYMLHRHPDHFPDPERFDPDRFLPENSVGRHPYCYAPFSIGPRNCVGYKYAMLQMKATMSKLLRHFKFLPPENPFLELDLTFQLITKSTNGVPVRLEPRTPMERQ